MVFVAGGRNADTSVQTYPAGMTPDGLKKHKVQDSNPGNSQIIVLYVRILVGNLHECSGILVPRLLEDYAYDDDNNAQMVQNPPRVLNRCNIEIHAISLFVKVRCERNWKWTNNCIHTNNGCHINVYV